MNKFAVPGVFVVSLDRFINAIAVISFIIIIIIVIVIASPKIYLIVKIDIYISYVNNNS